MGFELLGSDFELLDLVPLSLIWLLQSYCKTTFSRVNLNKHKSSNR